VVQWIPTSVEQLKSLQRPRGFRSYLHTEQEKEALESDQQGRLVVISFYRRAICRLMSRLPLLREGWQEIVAFMLSK
jgi:hypothetical protein